MTNPYKSSKICLHYASNGLARPTSIVGDTYRLDPSTAGHVYTSATNICMHTTIAALISMQTDVDADAMCDGVCKLKLFRSALGMGKIMRDPAPHVAHGRKTLQMCGIPAFDFMLVLP